MASTVSVNCVMKATGTQTFTGDEISGSNNTITYSGRDRDSSFNASSSVPVTKVAAGTVTLSGGTGSLNFAALSGRNSDETVDMTGLKPQIIKFVAPSTNANAITIAEGASNGLALLGASFTFKLLPGQEAQFYLADAAPDIASGDRVLDITGTGSQTLHWITYAG